MARNHVAPTVTVGQPLPVCQHHRRANLLILRGCVTTSYRGASLSTSTDNNYSSSSGSVGSWASLPEAAISKRCASSMSSSVVCA